MGVLVRKELLQSPSPDKPFHEAVVEKYADSAKHSRIAVYGDYDPESYCFYCDQHLSGEAVLYWRGSCPQVQYTGYGLLLHPGCFLEMTTRLFSDLHKMELVFDYHVLKNASPVPSRPVDRKDDGGWKVWRKLRDAMRDLTVVNQ